jgi:hydroxymethylglutaryl-CoA reductase (NADPH)
MTFRLLKTVEKRRKFLEQERGVSLKHTGTYTLDDAIASSHNCENMIGAAQVPMGVAGPLKVQSSKFKVQSYYVPLATTEGVLVASVNRGCKAITESGGALVDSYRVGATRGPVFHVADLRENDRLNRFLEEHLDELKRIAKETSRHLALTRFTSRGVGRYRYVRFVFDTQDAMGMNMATIASEHIVRFIERETGVPCVALAGNYDVDKKPSWLNVIEGRGIKAWAEITLPSKVLKEVLKTTAQRVYEVWLAKCLIGSAMAGSMGFNAHYANVLAALFCATGQDLAHVGEGSVGITTCEVVKIENSKLKIENYGLYISVYLPDLMVGTVGGGTGLATQKEALSILGIAGSSPAGEGGENAQKFAEIAGAAVLAGEISLLASLAEGSLARAHEKLGRGKE